MRKFNKNCRLHLITPQDLELNDFTASLKTLFTADKTGLIAVLQIRQKNLQTSKIFEIATSLKPICKKHKVTLLINDDPVLARDTGCDGVHIGQHDSSYENARTMVGDCGIIGVTCHDSIELAVTAEKKGADYVAFGAFFPTKTKKIKQMANSEILKTWGNISTVPSVAIGGITPQNCGVLVKSGANFLAVISYFWEHPQSPSAAIAEFREAIETAEPV